MQHLQPNTTLQGGKYRIERVLGQGGFGNTYVGYNTEFEETVQKEIAEYKSSYNFEDDTRNYSGHQMSRVETAIDSFNIEDLVKVAEDFVDAKVQIDHLKNGGKGELPHTKELAVITRTEGVVWIKHCLYGN